MMLFRALLLIVLGGLAACLDFDVEKYQPPCETTADCPYDWTCMYNQCVAPETPEHARPKPPITSDAGEPAPSDPADAGQSELPAVMDAGEEVTAPGVDAGQEPSTTSDAGEEVIAPGVDAGQEPSTTSDAGEEVIAPSVDAGQEPSTISDAGGETVEPELDAGVSAGGNCDGVICDENASCQAFACICNEGYFGSGTQCIPHTHDSCEEGYTLTPGTTSSDSACVQCATGTFDDDAAYTTDCISHTVTDCEDGNILTPGTITADGACIPCLGDTWDHDGDSLTECVGHGAVDCSEGQTYNPGTATTNNMCVDCEQSTYDDDLQQNTPCIAHTVTNCAHGSTLTLGTSTSDGVCVACENGNWDHDANATTACVAYYESSECPHGTAYDANAGSTTTSTCVPCPESFWDDDANAGNACVAHSNVSCGDEETLVEGTATTDNACAACPAVSCEEREISVCGVEPLGTIAAGSSTQIEIMVKNNCAYDVNDAEIDVVLNDTSEFGNTDVPSLKMSGSTGSTTSNSDCTVNKSLTGHSLVDYWADDDVYDLSAGETITITRTIEIPSWVAAGQHYIWSKLEWEDVNWDDDVDSKGIEIMVTNDTPVVYIRTIKNDLSVAGVCDNYDYEYDKSAIAAHFVLYDDDVDDMTGALLDKDSDPTMPFLDVALEPGTYYLRVKFKGDGDEQSGYSIVWGDTESELPTGVITAPDSLTINDPDEWEDSDDEDATATALNENEVQSHTTGRVSGYSDYDWFVFTVP